MTIKMKKAKYEKILHSCKEIIQIESLLNRAVDGLLNNVGITRQGFKTGGGLYVRKNRKTAAR